MLWRTSPWDYLGLVLEFMECKFYVFVTTVAILQMAYIGERVRCRGGRCELSCRVLGAYFELLLAVVVLFFFSLFFAEVMAKYSKNFVLHVS